MLFNFCDGRAKSYITCDKVCTDSNPVENLLSLEYRNKMAGFMSENFVRPPVNITLQLPCNIELVCVVINPVVGAQKSCGFEIYTCSNKVDTSPLLSDIQLRTSSNSSLFVSVGKIYINHPGVICFTSSQYDQINESDKKLLPALDQSCHHGNLRHGRPSALTFVSHLTVRITKTFSGSAVCMRQLEVWGKPSKSCSELVVNKVIELFSPRIDHNLQNTSLDKDRKEEQMLNLNSLSEDDMDIPEDFLDSITFELMTVPMLLPCSKNIDQSTLEKHTMREASWGRMPSDPFTGLVFDSQRKAIPNVSLKGRIDQFVLLNMDKLKHIPRTLGIVSPGPSVSRLANNEDLKCSSLESYSPSTSKSKDTFINDSRTGPENCLNKTERKIAQNFDLLETIGTKCQHLVTGVNKYESKKRKAKNMYVEPQVKIRKCGTLKDTIDLTVSEPTTVCEQSYVVKHDNDIIDLTENEPSTSLPSHAVNLADSLNNALNTALKTLPTFTKAAKGQQRSIDCCSLCKTTDMVVSYRLPCFHVICRLCLTSSMDFIVCKLCSTKSNTRDVIRTYFN